MKTKLFAVSLLAGFLLVCSLPARAAGPLAGRLGARMGFSAPGAADEYFRQYDVFYDFDLPWRWQRPDGWLIVSGADLSLGVLQGGGEKAAIGSGGLLLRFIRGITTVQLGGSVAGLSKNNLGNADFGGPLQFLAYVGLDFQLTRHLAVGGRLQHMSNGHIYHKNPSLNQGMLQLTFTF